MPLSLDRLQYGRVERGWPSTLSTRNSDLHDTASSLDRRAACPGSTYTALNTLSFDVYCKADFVFAGLGDPVAATDAENCMDQCASLDGERCYGVAYSIPEQECWFKDANVTADRGEKGFYSDPRFVLGLARRAQLEPVDLACPHEDGSIQNALNGQKFEINCDSRMVGHDICPGDDPNACPFHADSLDECLELCSNSSPLCYAVVFDPTMQGGFGNCYPKGTQKPSLITNQQQPASHMAIAKIPDLSSACDESAVRKASNGQEFQVNCGQNRIGYDMSYPFHADTLDDCIQTCAEYQDKAGRDCLAVTWNWSMTSGYMNCYLKSSTGVPSPDDGNTAAVLVKSSASNQPGAGGHTHEGAQHEGGQHGANNTPPANTDDGPTNMAWVAGPAVGGVVILGAFLFLFVYLLRRRRRKAQDQNRSVQDMSSPASSYQQKTPYPQARPILPEPEDQPSYYPAMPPTSATTQPSYRSLYHQNPLPMTPLAKLQPHTWLELDGYPGDEKHGLRGELDAFPGDYKARSPTELEAAPGPVELDAFGPTPTISPKLEPSLPSLKSLPSLPSSRSASYRSYRSGSYRSDSYRTDRSVR